MTENSKSEALSSFLMTKVIAVLAICGLVRECYAEQDAQREMQCIDNKVAAYTAALPNYADSLATFDRANTIKWYDAAPCSPVDMMTARADLRRRTNLLGAKREVDKKIAHYRDSLMNASVILKR